MSKETLVTGEASYNDGDVQAGPIQTRRQEDLRLLEAILFAATEPLDLQTLKDRFPERSDVPLLIEDLTRFYAHRGVNLVRTGDRYAFRTALDLAARLQVQAVVARKLSRAAVETLAIIAYHQPVTRAEIEEIRGVALSKGTLDILLEAEWVKPKGRRRAPGRPVTWVTTEAFLSHFGLAAIDDLPGLDELKQAGLLEARSGMTLNDMADPDLLSYARDPGEDTDEDTDEAGERSEVTEDFPHALPPGADGVRGSDE